MCNKVNLSVVFLAAALVGCRSVNTAEPQELRSNPNVIPEHKVIRDPSLNRVARIVDIRENRLDSGLLKIQATVQNTTLSRQRFNYMIEWIDEKGMTMDTPLSRWTQMSLAGKETGSIVAVAPSPRAADYRIKLMEAKD